MSAASTTTAQPASAFVAEPEQWETPYLEALLAHAGRDPGRFHVPGHKGGAGAGPDLLAAIGEGTLGLDLPAYIDGVDLGPDPTPLEQARELAARAWGARRTWFLVGGASEASRAICLAMTRAGSTALVQRNVHVSTINGLVISGLRPVFLEPATDEDLDVAHSVSPEVLDEALERAHDVAAVFVVSPTYFGVAGDVAGLAEVTRAHGVALVVDEAWGAHFRFHPNLPQDALSAGADLVISSTHKTIGSLTGSAMLHLGARSSGPIDEGDLNRALAVVRSTSPCSLLLASLDAARCMAATKGRELLERTMAGAQTVRAELRRIAGVEVLDERIVGRPGVVDFDATRVVIDVRGTGASGHGVFRALRRLDDVHLELATQEVLVLHLGMADDPAPNAQPLAAALERAISGSRNGARWRRLPRRPSRGPLVLSPREGYLAAHEAVPLREAAGRVAAESLSLYPPGVATVVAGERVRAATLAFIESTLRQGGRVRGSADPTGATMLVVSSSEDPGDAARAEVATDADGELLPGGGAATIAAVAPAQEAVAAPEHAAFEDFPARAYLEKYYSGMGAENAVLLDTVVDYIAATGAPTGRVVEVAGGPSLLSMLALAAVRGEPFEEVLFTDLGQANLDEVERWLTQDPMRFDYSHLLAWLEQRTGAQPEAVSAALRASHWELSSFDWKGDPPPEWCGRFDVVASHFFAESATSNEEEFIAMMRRVPRLGRPGAVALLSFMSRSRGYTIDGADFPGFDVDETTVLGYLRAAGVSLSDLHLRTVPAEDPGSDPGYEGLLFVAGRLAPAGEPGV
jgi:lysine decarboxylase